MSEREIIKVLREIGLSRREADIYIFLSKMGMQGVNVVSTGTKIDRVQTYRLLKSLQEKGIVEATLESPTRFRAISFETIIDSLVKTKKTEVADLEDEKNGLILYWKSLSAKMSEYPVAKFRVLKEQKGIFAEISRMIKESEKEILELTTSLGVTQEDIAGILDSIIRSAAKKTHVQFKILANISRENLPIVEKVVNTVSSKNLNVEWRHISVDSRTYPRFIIKDEEETVLYITSKDELPILSQADTGLWINSGIFVSTLRQAFMELWHDSVRAEKRIEELKTGKPIEETKVIRDAQEVQSKLRRILDEAENDVIAITSSEGMTKILGDELLNEYLGKGPRFRIMAPIDLDNFEAAYKLSEFCEVKHVPISYMMMIAVDNKHLFIFKTPPFEEATTKMAFYLNDAFYTDDSEYVDRITEMLNDIWKRGLDVKEVTSGAIDKTVRIQVSSLETVSEVIDKMLKNNVDSITVTENGNPIGIVSQKDIIEKVLIPKKDFEKTLAREIASTPILTIETDKSLTDALEIMRTTGTQRLAVIKDKKLIGMFSSKRTAQTKEGSPTQRTA